MKRAAPAVALLSACLATEGPPGLRPGTGDAGAGPSDAGVDVSAGAEVYANPLAGGRMAYPFACATCHALAEPAPDGRRRPGHPIGDVARRPAWHGGKAATLLAAVNACLDDWMEAPPWTEEEPRWVALRAFLEAQAPPGAAPALTIARVAPPPDLAGGDPSRGRDAFDRTCAICHGLGATGTVRGPPLAGAFHDVDAPYIASRVRNSGPSDSTVHTSLGGGLMPFWSADRLEDRELRDLISFLVR